MFETGTFHRNRPKDGAKGDVMRSFAVTQLAAVRAVALAVQVRLHLPFDDDFLQGLQQSFAVRYRKTQAFGRQVIPFNTRQVADRFLAIVGGGDHLHPHFHGSPPTRWAWSRSCALMRRRLILWGLNSW
jgi:hypothetical protein